jgi:hypothetical protein
LTQWKALANDTPDDPDADLRKWLRDCAKVNARKGFRRSWADLCPADWVNNQEEGNVSGARKDLRVKVRKIRKRAGASTTPITEAGAPKVVWAIDFREARVVIEDCNNRHRHSSLLAYRPPNGYAASCIYPR